MRLALGLIAASVALSACTASPMLDGMNRIALTEASEPVPANYKDLLRHHFGRNRASDLQITAPRPLIAASVTEPARWFVCIRTADGAESAHVIDGGKLAGTIPGSTPELCAGGVYEPLG